jgi:hypothetical protein
MKRNTVIAVALCLMMIATAGASAASAKQDENPRHAGKSSIYFYDVDATDSHGFGQLVINVDKHTFVFIGKDFVPSSQIELRARAEGSSDYVVFASGKATPSGNLHIAGTWEEDAPPAEVSGGYAQLYGYWLYMNGWFIAKIASYYSIDDGVTWTESDHTGDITKGHWADAHLIDLGVPNGALVKIHVIVVGGKDQTGGEVYQCNYYYQWPGYCYQYYEIDGVTWNPNLYQAPSGYQCYMEP